MNDTKCSGVLFDLDGTLVDSLRDIGDAMNAVLAARGLPEHSLDAYRVFVGDGMEVLARRALPESRRDTPDTVAALVAEMKREYATRWSHHANPYPGVREMIHTLRRTGLRLGVLSNKPDAFTREMVAHVFPDMEWDAVRGAREDVPLKPAPDAAREILRTWALSPEQVAYVGDTLTDMLTARNTGMPGIGVTWGFRDRAELEAHGAEIVVDHPTEILRWIMNA